MLRRRGLLRNILISEELIGQQDPEISDLLRRLKFADITPMQAKLIRRKLRKKGFRLRQHVGSVPRKVRIKKPKGPLLLPYYPRGAREAAGEEITKRKRVPRAPKAPLLPGPLKRKTRAKLLSKNWTRPGGTSFRTPFEDAADLLELEYSPVEIMRKIMAKWKMTPLEFKNEVVRKMHRDPILSKMWGESLEITHPVNPPRMKVIYDSVLAIEAQKGSQSQFPNEKFRHDFKGETKARVIGLPDGSLLIKGKKRLWKEFDY